MNTNKFNTKKITTMAMLSAIGVVLVMLIRVPFPLLPFLEYDPADIPILVGTLAFGTVEGLILTVIVSALQALTVSAASGVYGFIMHVVATGAMVVVVGTVYHRFGNENSKSLFSSLLLGAISMVIVMIPANLFITPLFMGTPVREVVKLLLPGIIPFNAMKGLINAAMSYLLTKGLSRTNVFKG